MKKLFFACILVLGFIFLPTSILLVFGMMPTLAAYAIDKSPGKCKTLCVGFMNFAGCFPFLLELWTTFGGHTVENAFRMIAEAQNVIIIYLLAGGGYAIDIAITGITATLIVQNSARRMQRLKRQQDKLVEFWGDKVTGRYPLDDAGFPIQDHPSSAQKKKKPDSN